MRKPLQALVETDGFTLIEVLVALTILGISLAVLLGAFSQDLAVSGETAVQMRARSLVEALIAQTQVSNALHPGSRTGETADGISWRVDVQPYEAVANTALPVGLFAVRASAYWTEDGRQKTVHLETLDLASKEQSS